MFFSVKYKVYALEHFSREQPITQLQINQLNFIGYNDNDVVRRLCIKLPQMTGHVKNFESNTTMSFKIRDKQFLK